MKGAAAPAKTGFWGTLPRVALIRLIIFFLALTLADAAVFILPVEIAKRLPEAAREPVMLGGVIVLALVLLVIYTGLVRLIERRRARELALVTGISFAIGGAVFGFALFAAVFAVLCGLGGAQYNGFVGFAGIVPALIMGVVSAVGEEVIFRGAVFRILEDSLGTLGALVLSAALFGLLHAANHGATTVSTIAIALEAGALLALSYAATRSLWFPIGLHFGWNFTEGGIFGQAVSGSSFHGVLKTSLAGTDILTGGAFGPEASVVAVAVCVAAALVLAIVAVRAGRWKPISFRMLLD
jgi:hypothetical protein